MNWNQDGGNQFGNRSMDGGGGFTSPGGFMNNSTFDSPSVSQDKQKGKKNLAVVPVTVAMIKNATHDPVEDICDLGGVKIHQVKLVGIIRKIDELQAYISYEIDDLTGGTISVRKWSDKDDNEQSSSPFREDTYVSVVGYIKVYEGDKRTITAFVMSRVTDFNEITYHMMSVIHSNLIISKIAAGDEAPAVSPGGMQFKKNSSFSAQQSFQGSGMDKIHQEVLQVIVNCTEDEGMGTAQIRQKLPQLSEQNTREAIDHLCGEGHIYSTVDDDHFRATS